MTEPTQAQLLLVDDDATVIQAMAKVLREQAQLRFARTAAEALAQAQREKPDLVLLDAELPDGSGLDVLRQLRALPGYEELAVIIVTSHNDADTEERCLELGAADFIGKPLRPSVLKARVRTQLRLKQTLDAVRALSVTDMLTGCANRRALMSRLSSEWPRAWRSRLPFALLMVDVDHFKRFNDRYGHLQGDQALRLVGEVLRSSVGRPADCVARYGGEEFCLLLPDTDAEGARRIAEQVQRRLAERALPHADSEHGRLTLSMGLASFEPPDQILAEPPPPPERLLALADAQLYAAKAAGRNGLAEARFEIG